ncbi:MAG: pilus assembly protein TadG-related protein [Bacillota bacterium]
MITIKNLIKDRSGNSTIVLMVAMTLIIGASALVTDAGMIYIEKTKLQNAVDAAALAGISAYSQGESAVISEVYESAQLNKLDISTLNIQLMNSNRKITVEASKKVNFYFAKIFNKTDAVVDARATAVIAPLVAVDGIKPLGVEQQQFVFGATYVLKCGAGDGSNGNYGALALGGTGASNYKYNLIHGYHGDLETGDLVKIGYTLDTEPGNMEGPTYDAIRQIIESDYNTYTDLTRLPLDSPRLFTIPVVDDFDVSGRDTVTIVGFATFFIDDVVFRGGKTEITGKFIKTLGEGEIDEYSPDYGFYGIKLVE